MRLFDSPDDVLRPKGGVTAEENTGLRRLKGFQINQRHVPLVELDTKIALDPRKRILLANGQDDVVGRLELLADDTLGRNPAVRVDVVFHLVEQHSGEPAVCDDEGFGHAVDDDLDVLFFSVLEFPCGGFEEAARLARHHFHALRAKAQARAAAVHRGVADPDDEHPLADLVQMPEGDCAEPCDADMDIGCAFAAAGQIELLTLRRAGTDEHGVIAVVF